jgi:hypothetical protein
MFRPAFLGQPSLSQQGLDLVLVRLTGFRGQIHIRGTDERFHQSKILCIHEVSQIIINYILFNYIDHQIWETRRKKESSSIYLMASPTWTSTTDLPKKTTNQLVMKLGKCSWNASSRANVSKTTTTSATVSRTESTRNARLCATTTICVARRRPSGSRVTARTTRGELFFVNNLFNESELQLFGRARNDARTLFELAAGSLLEVVERLVGDPELRVAHLQVVNRLLFIVHGLHRCLKRVPLRTMLRLYV